MASPVFVALDLGASSGRHVAGAFDGQRLSIEELYRFENGPVQLGGRLYWDLLNQWTHVQHGLRAAASLHGSRIRSIGVDTWGVDFGLLGARRRTVGKSLQLPGSRTRRHARARVCHRAA